MYENQINLNIKDKKMSVFVKGEGEINLVMLSDSGIAFPHLEYSKLVDFLASKHKVVVLEKFGYGFSQVINEQRDVDMVIEEYRISLQELNIFEPICIVAFGMGFMEALRWSQRSPGDISCLIGIDPVTPECCGDFDIEQTINELLLLCEKGPAYHYYVQMLFHQLHSNFIWTEEGSKQYKKKLEEIIANQNWISELENLRRNIILAVEGEVVQIPTLFFVSNGEGVLTSCEQWRKYALSYLEQVEVHAYRFFERPCNLYKYVYEENADSVNEFLSYIK